LAFAIGYDLFYSSYFSEGYPVLIEQNLDPKMMLFSAVAASNSSPARIHLELS